MPPLVRVACILAFVSVTGVLLIKELGLGEWAIAVLFFVGMFAASLGDRARFYGTEADFLPPRDRATSGSARRPPG